jgi:Tol biopolymer transport system component
MPVAGCRMPVPDAGKQKMYIMKLSGRHRFWRILSSVQHTNFTDAAAKSTWQTQTSNSAVISCRANFVSFSTYFSLKACVPKNFSTAPSELPSIV